MSLLELTTLIFLEESERVGVFYLFRLVVEIWEIFLKTKESMPYLTLDSIRLPLDVL